MCVSAMGMRRVRVDNNEIVLDVITLGTYIIVK